MVVAKVGVAEGGRESWSLELNNKTSVVMRIICTIDMV